MVSTGDSSPAGSGPGSTDPGARPAEEALHEIRATAVGLELASQVLAAPGTQLTPARRRRLQRMHDSETARLKRLLGGWRQTSVDIDLDEVVLPLVEGLRLRGHDVRWRHHQARAFGRPDDVAEIVHILLENAVRHAPGTTVTIEPVAHVPGWTGVRVFDQGTGIAEATRPLLFVRGGRGPGSPGLGLGLSVARRLAWEMGGSLVLEPASPPRGASFRLALPRDLVHAYGA